MSNELKQLYMGFTAKSKMMIITCGCGSQVRDYVEAVEYKKQRGLTLECGSCVQSRLAQKAAQDHLVAMAARVYPAPKHFYSRQQCACGAVVTEAQTGCHVCHSSFVD